MEKLFTLLTLQRQAMETQDIKGFYHYVVNYTSRLLPYQQSIVWSYQGQKVTLEKISGNVVLDPIGPIANKISSHIEGIISSASSFIQQTEFEKRPITLSFFRNNQGEVIGGLWIETDAQYQEAEIKILEEVSVTYAYVMAHLQMRQRLKFWNKATDALKYRKAIISCAIILALLPVRQTITAPAEIVARDADVITVPFDGMIEGIEVDPGDTVTDGQIVAKMDTTNLNAQVTIARQELNVAESKLARLQREAVENPDKGSDLNILQSEINKKQVELNYAETVQKNADITATRAGTAIFSDANRLKGKPARMGDVVMTVADPQDAELLVRIPVQSLLPIEEGYKVVFYLNASPLSGRLAKVKTIGYQATPDPDGLLTYKILADIEDKENLRIGWQGTAKVKGNWTILSYLILRKPLASIRYMTGL
jgi:hypothetical protein